MNDDKLRRQIAFEAARLLFLRHESEYLRATQKAARRACRGRLRNSDLPTATEIRDQIQQFSRLCEGDNLPEEVGQMRMDAWRGNDAETAGGNAGPDRFDVYRARLLPLEHVQQNRLEHPEGDALYHSLQVFDLARNAAAHDEEFLLAALLHDVGYALDRHAPVVAGRAALAGFITERTDWFIANLGDAHALHAGTLGVRARRRLAATPDFDDLVVLGRCDRAGRVRGAQPPDLDDALHDLRELSRLCGG